MARQQVQQYTNRSRLALGQPAIRANMKGKMLLAGPSGAGKTYTALLIASVLAGPDRTTRSIAMLDTEKSGSTYAQEFNLSDGTPGYMIVPWQEPYNATDLAMTLRDASADPEVRVVIVDSHTHFWRGQGGVLDTASGRYTGWKEARPMQADMVDAILTCDAHVILCAREVQEHVQEKDGDRWVVRKLGMKVQQDSDLEYEVNVGLTIDMNHVLHVSKSRTSAVPVGTEFIAGHAERFAGLYRDWLIGGEPAATQADLGALLGAFNRIEDAAARAQAKFDFVDAFGRPEALLMSRLPDAQAWVADRLLGLDTADRAPDSAPKADTTHEHGEEPPCRRPDCGHDRARHAALHEPDDGLGKCIVAGCKCAAYTDADDTAPAGGSDAPAGPVAPTTDETAAGPETATQAVSDDPSDATIEAQIIADVEAMPLADLHSALTTAGRSSNGSIKNLRERLVKERLKSATVPL